MLTFIGSTSTPQKDVFTGKQGKLSCWNWKEYGGSPLIFKADSKVGIIEG